MSRIFLLVLSFQLIVCTVPTFAGNVPETSGQTIMPRETKHGEKSPLVIIYTLSTCPHCMEAKEYLTRNKIPFINREVDTNDEQLATLMSIYDVMGVPEEKRGVPFFVIGNRARIQGFNKDTLQNALKEATSNQK